MRLLTSYFLPLNAHPLFYATFFLMGGIWWQSQQPFYAIPLSISIGILFLLFLRITNKKTLLFFSLPFVCAAGAILYQHQHTQHESFYNQIGEKPFDTQAIITDIEKLEKGFMRHRTTLHITAFRPPKKKNWQSISKTIQLYTAKPINVLVSDFVELENITCKKPANQSFNNYLIKEGVSASIFTNTVEHKLISRPSWSIRRWIFYVKKNFIDRCKRKCSLQTFALLSSLFLGNRTIGKRVMESPKEQFKLWGISHFLARSGLHLVIFILIWQTLLSFTPLPFVAKELLLLGLSIIYFLLSWPSTSFIRAFSTFILYKTCTLFSVPINFIHLLTLVCFFVLLFNPMQLFFLDFQLSFGLTCALGWFNYLQHQKRRLA